MYTIPKSCRPRPSRLHIAHGEGTGRALERSIRPVRLYGRWVHFGVLSSRFLLSLFDFSVDERLLARDLLVDSRLFPPSEARILRDRARAPPVHGGNDTQGTQRVSGRTYAGTLRHYVASRNMGHQQHARTEARHAAGHVFRSGATRLARSVGDRRHSGAQWQHRALERESAWSAGAHAGE